MEKEMREEKVGKLWDLCHIDDDIAGGVDPQHEMVEPGEVLSPSWPVQNCTILKHLNMEKGLRTVMMDYNLT
jgi:hypothetical protein